MDQRQKSLKKLHQHILSYIPPSPHTVAQAQKQLRAMIQIKFLNSASNQNYRFPKTPHSPQRFSSLDETINLNQQCFSFRQTMNPVRPLKQIHLYTQNKSPITHNNHHDTHHSNQHVPAKKAIEQSTKKKLKIKIARCKNEERITTEEYKDSTSADIKHNQWYDWGHKNINKENMYKIMKGDSASKERLKTDYVSFKKDKYTSQKYYVKANTFQNRYKLNTLTKSFIDLKSQLNKSYENSNSMKFGEKQNAVDDKCKGIKKGHQRVHSMITEKKICRLF